MRRPTLNCAPARSHGRSIGKTLAVMSIVGLSLAACRPDGVGGQVSGWELLDPAQRHPILVSREPATLRLGVSRGSYGLHPGQRSRLEHFLAKYRSKDAGNSKLVIAVPSGAPNEVAAMQVVAEVRHLVSEYGFNPASVRVKAYHDRGNPQPPVRVSYLRYVAQAPECGDWPTNLANEPANVAYPNFGCATQRNLAVMVANPADLLGPRTETPRPNDRRATTWDKYRKGESSAANKKADEQISTTSK